MIIFMEMLISKNDIDFKIYSYFYKSYMYVYHSFFLLQKQIKMSCESGTI